jgi:hypothetical protein
MSELPTPADKAEKGFASASVVAEPVPEFAALELDWAANAV